MVTSGRDLDQDSELSFDLCLEALGTHGRVDAKDAPSTVVCGAEGGNVPKKCEDGVVAVVPALGVELVAYRLTCR